MNDFSQAFVDKIDTILEQWIERLRDDRRVKTALSLSDTALGDDIPKVLSAMATILTRSPEDDDYGTIYEASLEHGAYRARQGYDPGEIALEFSLLRREIFAALEPEMLTADVSDVIRVFKVIDIVLDQAVSRSFNTYVEERLKELQQLQSQMQLTNQELVRLNQSSQNTFTYLSQELKTPLNLIVGYSDLLLRQQQREVQPRQNVASNIENLERVQRYGRQLLRLVNDSLELARTESGEIQLRPLLINVNSVINGTVDVIQPLASSKNLEIVTQRDRAPTKATTDPFRLQQILTNLLTNAVDYTESGSIQVICQTLPEQKWSLAVTDTGIGIAPEDQQRIFEPFAAIFEENIRQEKNGTGLSLAVVSRLVKLLQGEISLESQVGVGSTFTLTFPLALESKASAEDTPQS